MVISSHFPSINGGTMNWKHALATAAVGGIAAIGVGAALPAGAATSQTPSTSSSSSTSSATATSCSDGHWPAAVDGRPTQLAPGAAAGVYLWHDGAGWHAFVTHPGHQKVTFNISVTSQAKLVATRARDEHDDVVLEHNDDHTATLHAQNFGYLDGMNFRTDCSPRIVVSGTVEGRPLTPSDVFVGRGNDHPDHVPFIVTRKA
jgi:hypothetical protein